MTEYVNVKQLLRAIYMRLTMSGIYEISLNHEDLSRYVPEIERLFNEKSIITGDLFVKTPVTETYDTYRDYLIGVLLDKNLGNFNNSYNAIVLNCTGWYAANELKSLTSYQGLIEDCANAIISRREGRGTRINR